MLRVIVALIFVAWATEAGDQLFCSNEEQYYNIYRVGSKSCPCTKENTGALRYANKRLDICNGEKYEAVCTDRSELGTKDNPAHSCKQILTEKPGARSGVYHLKLHGQVIQTYCEMGSICGGTGWTMIMKLDGKHRTFHYKSGYWTQKNTYNPRAAEGGLNTHETKLATYHLFPFSNLCVGMRVGGSLKWLKIPYRASSLYAVIADNKFRHTRLGRNAWKNLVPGASLQRNCNMEGFNVNFQGRLGMSEARIGIIANQENNCHSPDSRIAFGGGGAHCEQNDNHSVGNEARCHPDNGDKSIVGFGYIMAQ